MPAQDQDQQVQLFVKKSRTFQTVLLSMPLAHSLHQPFPSSLQHFWPCGLSLLVFKARCWKRPQVQELEAGAPDMGPKPSTPQGEPLGTEFPPRVGFHARVVFGQRTVSKPVLSFSHLADMNGLLS